MGAETEKEREHEGVWVGGGGRVARSCWRVINISQVFFAASTSKKCLWASEKWATNYRKSSVDRGLIGLFVGWLLNVPATCKCIPGTDLLRQFYVLPH